MLGIDHDLRALAALVSGPVTRPGDGDDFDAECVGFDLNSVQDPAVAIGAIDAADVIAGVQFARTHDMPVSVQATGHGATATADGGLLIATRRFDGVRIDPATRTAYVSAGARWQKVIDAAAAQGLAPLCGSSPDVGAVSYTTGGGLGPLGRPYGFAADHVRRIDLVTADGEPRTVTADRDADLFWAVRGGGGNFGVVTAIEIDLMPVTELYGGGLFFPGAATGSVLGEFLACRAAAPEDVTLSVAVLTFPDLPVLPPPLRGTYCCHVRVAATAPAEQVEALIAPLRRAAPALVDTIRTMPFTEVASIHGDPSGPMPTHVRSLVLRDVDRDTMAGILRYVDPTMPFMLELRDLRGALSRPAAVPNPVGHRGGDLNLFLSAYPVPDGYERADAVQRDLLARMRPWSDGGALFTFLAGAHVTREDVRGAFDDADFARLTALKTRWDPGNMFRFNQNIAPLREAAT